jgi:amidophosphoribosyltransferase
LRAFTNPALNLGDWYFTGNYPTPGGNKVVNKAFMNSWKGRM